MANLPDAYLPSISIFLLFALLHSILASPGVKAYLFEKISMLKVSYRLFYNLLSLVCIGCFVWLLPSDITLYRAEGVLFYLLIAIQIAALTGLLRSFIETDVSIFTGVRQIRNYIRNGELPSYLDEPDRGKLKTDGCYRFMRHPTYTFSVLLLLATPVMTANALFALICLAAYFWAGSIHEERSLIKRFGSQYRRYRSRVPKFVPGPAHLYRTLIEAEK